MINSRLTPIFPEILCARGDCRGHWHRYLRLAELKDLHERGVISDAELAAARAKIIAGEYRPSAALPDGTPMAAGRS